MDQLELSKSLLWGGGVVCLIIVFTPGPVLTRNGTNPGKDQDLDQELDNSGECCHTEI